MRSKEQIRIILKKLNSDARDFLRKEYNMSLNIPIVISNKEPDYINGAFYYQENTPLNISLNERILKENSFNSIRGTLYHELIHYALFSKNLPFCDLDATFVEHCKSRQVPLYGDTPLGVELHNFKCSTHNQIILKRRSLLNILKIVNYHCNECDEKLEYIGKW